MSFLKSLRKLAAFCGVMLIGTLVGVLGFTLVYPVLEPANPQGGVIVVLGGGMSPDGTLHRSSTVRVDRAVELYKNGAAPQLHFTGGRHRSDAPSAGDQMAARAASFGVPRDAMTAETASQSTLQNALFSLPQLNSHQRIILVTEGFHLPRSWVSFKVFGAKEITLINARRFRDTPASSARMVLREALAIWFNAARFLVWKTAQLIDMPASERDALLY